MLIYALALAASEPSPLTEAHQRDIACVAVIGIIAYEQRAGKTSLQEFPDVRDPGKRWAGIVGDRIVFETGQPREVVAYAIGLAVDTEQNHVMNIADPKAYADARFAACKLIMEEQLTAADGLTP